jgi:hypothetical protein
MTLVIAYLLMYQIGDFSPLAYIAVFVVWFMHICYHDNDVKKKMLK